MRRKSTMTAPLRVTSATATWVLRVAMLCTGLLATLALVIVLASLVPVMIVAAATPARAASAMHGPKKSSGHLTHRGASSTD